MFATQPINKNKRIIHYSGEKIDNKESLKREARYIKQGHIWCFKLTNRTVIDGHVGGNISRQPEDAPRSVRSLFRRA